MTSPTLYVDVHILQDLPPSNINRDDNGTPKQAVYGGVSRLRVSSQAWKRAVRLEFAADLPKEATGVRTRRLTQLFTAELAERGLPESDATVLAAEAVKSLGITAGKKDDLSYLLFFSRGQLDTMASAVAAAAGDLTQSKTIDKAMLELGLKETLRAGHSLDVALFGRMVADLADLNVDAASQVAHAISTHAAKTQFDYFTAVDDEQEEAETGAGMIGTVEFNSATMYRFATVAVPQLAANLGDHAAAFDGVARFIRAFALSMPTGHQTSFAARTRPALVLVVVRQDQPVNLVSAFERPVWPGQQGVMAGSQEALADFYQTEVQRWGDQPALVVASYNAVDDKGHEKLVAAFGASRPLDEVIEAVGDVLRGLGRDHD